MARVSRPSISIAPPVGSIEPVDHLERRGLPAAELAQEHEQLAAGDIDAHAIDSAHAARVGLADGAEADHRRVRRRRCRR
jgi:hypothetical protein